MTVAIYHRGPHKTQAWHHEHPETPPPTGAHIRTFHLTPSHQQLTATLPAGLYDVEVHDSGGNFTGGCFTVRYPLPFKVTTGKTTNLDVLKGCGGTY